MNPPILGEFSLDRMISAVEKVRQRLLRAASALDQAGVPYAVAGGNAVAAWVARVDEAAVRNTQDVDVLLRRSDLVAAIRALGDSGFVYRHAADIDMFLDGPDAKARDAVQVVFAGEKVRAEHEIVAPDVDPAETATGFRVLPLRELVLMKLTSYRRKDQAHLQDLASVGLVDASWLPELPEPLAARLALILADPDG